MHVNHGHLVEPDVPAQAGIPHIVAECRVIVKPIAVFTGVEPEQVNCDVTNVATPEFNTRNGGAILLVRAIVFVKTLPPITVVWHRKLLLLRVIAVKIY